MANLVYIATSLDDYIATPDGKVDWLSQIPNPTKSDYGFGAFMKRVDAVLMGRHTFEVVHETGQWPYIKKVFVLSNSLNQLPSGYEGKAEIISGGVEEVLEKLKNKGFDDLYVDGGKVIQSFLERDLIDEMIITRVPVVLGDGIPLFGKLNKSVSFSKVETEVLNDVLVKSHYYR